MYTDIEKFIQKRANEMSRDFDYNVSFDCHPAFLKQNIFEFGFKYGCKFILDLYKWKKIDKEFPEEQEDPYWINVKYENGNIEALCVEEGTNWIDVLSRMNAVEWKPIPLKENKK